MKNIRLRVDDRVKVIGVPPNLKDDVDLQTRALFKKCVNQVFVVAGIEQPEGLPERLIRLDVGQVLGEEPHTNTIWIEESFVEKA